ncbi:hypothetical protein ACL6C3_20115 [Capilliphycus salinus ALCB114379]|uniref:hypothetical protein n=1 Tax=Capilliphycus salinus TaxID=2768948 RepID=UPI0039A60E3F
MPTYSGWSYSGSGEQDFGESGKHTLVTFAKSQKSITIESQKASDRIRAEYNMEDDDDLTGIFFYDGVRLRMTYKYSYSRIAYNGEATRRKVERREKEKLPCKYLILGILTQKPEIQELPIHEDEPVWSITISRGYMDEPGDLHDTMTSSIIRYEFNLSEMTCAYSYYYHGDFAH